MKNPAREGLGRVHQSRRYELAPIKLALKWALLSSHITYIDYNIENQY